MRKNNGCEKSRRTAAGREGSACRCEGGERVRRAIHIFPEFQNACAIDRLREKYDPLFHLIQPHVTLVFPFASGVPAESLRQHVKLSVRGLSPFEIVLRGVTGVDGEYLFLNVKVGNDRIIELHDRLYSGILAQHLNRTVTYSPHLTVGRINDKGIFELALAETEHFGETFQATVHEIVVEKIDEGGKSTVEMTVPLD
ncbi:2'-5' RNA ligase family protein [Alicyclobacillus dauci]|uniref:2'-5' RNA ligase family protein n=1 Tax=Alicyclobacillus dauci TaxID=1475485 RepID=A0ABY6Z7V3_9BACL|nr:2'-5' RNA ligase family protein [Alicyclobacillus dauci]WAH38773.1 2'-5' RNA ligase family protein [Alicyclobacillus dauci]